MEDENMNTSGNTEGKRWNIAWRWAEDAPFSGLNSLWWVTLYWSEAKSVLNMASVRLWYGPEKLNLRYVCVLAGSPSFSCSFFYYFLACIKDMFLNPKEPLEWRKLQHTALWRPINPNVSRGFSYSFHTWYLSVHMNRHKLKFSEKPNVLSSPQRQGPSVSCCEWQENNEAFFVLQWRGVARQQSDVGWELRGEEWKEEVSEFAVLS